MMNACRSTHRQARLLSVMVLASLLAAGCGPAGSESTPHSLPTPTPAATALAPGKEVRSPRPRELAPDVSPGDLAALANGNRAFAVDLYQAVRGEDGNLFFSPYSVSLALAMAYAGARGDTEAEMADTLHFTLPPDRLHPAFNATDLSLGAAGDEAFRLSIANALWGQEGFDFLADYLDTLAINYGAGLRLADFVDPNAREQARQTINLWVSDKTEGKIPELLAQGALGDDTRLVLTNAIYFKADWETPFVAESTRPAPFTLLDGSTVQAPTMARRAQTGYAAGDGYEALELTYKGGRTSMIILLPAAGSFKTFEDSLDSASLDEILGGLQPTDLEIYVPKFKYSAELALADTLASLGMPSAFDAGAADFSGMDGRRDLVVTGVMHKAYVAVDEKGTEAAAATGLVVGATSMPQTVAVDRPFIYLIRDQKTGTALFMGRVVNPLD